jgi:hypothetical protein
MKTLITAPAFPAAAIIPLAAHGGAARPCRVFGNYWRLPTFVGKARYESGS